MAAKNKQILAMISLILVLAACGKGINSNEKFSYPILEIEQAIRENLKDPASAQFKNLAISKGGSYACVHWNAKNSMGGYNDWATAQLRKSGSAWEVISMQASEPMCNADVVLDDGRR